MRFCADSIRSCFFIEKSGASRGCPCLLEKAMTLSPNVVVLLRPRWELMSAFRCAWKCSNHAALVTLKGAARFSNDDGTNLAQTTASLPSPLVGFHLQVDFLNKIHHLFSVHKPSSLQLYASVIVALE